MMNKNVIVSVHVAEVFTVEFAIQQYLLNFDLLLQQIVKKLNLFGKCIFNITKCVKIVRIDSIIIVSNAYKLYKISIFTLIG